MTTTQTATAKPSHRIYSVSGTGKSANWTEIGAAWPNKDGLGFSIACEAMPLSGRIVMRTITERPAASRLPDGMEQPFHGHHESGAGVHQQNQFKACHGFLPVSPALNCADERPPAHRPSATLKAASRPGGPLLHGRKRGALVAARGWLNRPDPLNGAGGARNP